MTYGFGFEAETGNPGGTIQTNSGNPIRLFAGGTEAGVSPRVSLDVSRINLRGTQDSLTPSDDLWSAGADCSSDLPESKLFRVKEFLDDGLGWIHQHSGHHDLRLLDASGQYSRDGEGGIGPIPSSMSFSIDA